LTLTVSIHKNLDFGSCEECKESLIESSGHLVCSDCGLVSERIIVQPKWVLSSKIQKQEFILNGCANNNTFKKYGHSGGKNNHDIFLLYNEVLQKICYDLNFTEQAILRCLKIFKDYSENVEEHRKKITSKHYSSVLAFLSVYQTIVEHKFFISLNKIYETFLEFNKTHIAKEVISKAIVSFNITRRFTVEDYLKKFHSQLLLSFPNLEPQTEKVFELAKLKRKFQGSNPETFAGAILYLTYYDWINRKPRGMVQQLAKITGKSLGAVSNFRILAFKILTELNKEGI